MSSFISECHCTNDTKTALKIKKPNYIQYILVSYTRSTGLYQGCVHLHMLLLSEDKDLTVQNNLIK